MDASIVTQLDEKRKRTALNIASRMHGKPGSGRLSDGWRLGSGAILYNPLDRTVIGCLSRTCCRESTGPCPDCVHALAARYYLAAETTVIELARRQDISLNLAYSRLCSQAENPDIGFAYRQRLLVLRQAARYLVVWQDYDTLSEQNRREAYKSLQRYLNTPVRDLAKAQR